MTTVSSRGMVPFETFFANPKNAMPSTEAAGRSVMAITIAYRSSNYAPLNNAQ